MPPFWLMAFTHNWAPWTMGSSVPPTGPLTVPTLASSTGDFGRGPGAGRATGRAVRHRRASPG